ncbi:hypothetical protein A0H81_05925 [Grifola frondosa]|uniref:Smr domain-containing protein n=1 Tax=Grifola frondosa TaxID=5627 RepID=A0A1C7MB58_GRIFR|nr:hypothetical protein A0H81_05925 [Grifola frondosa]
MHYEASSGPAIHPTTTAPFTLASTVSPITHPFPTNAWKTVPSKPTPKGPHPLADYIPAYNSAPGTRKIRGTGMCQANAGREMLAWELMERRRAALRQAGRAWKRGHAKNRGGDVAFYFAEKARELQAQARQEQMIAARERVQATRRVSANTVMVDLHGLVVAEAIQVVKDVLQEDGASSDKPLNIITGKGTHSVGGVGVLALQSRVPSKKTGGW